MVLVCSVVILAQLDRGGIYADGSNLNFSTNLTISSNAVQVGGGIYSDNSTMNSNGCTVVERNVMAEGSS